MQISSRFLPLAIVLTTLAFVARPSPGQVTDADLVRENERLEAKVGDLTAALEAALARIAELEKALESLKAGGPVANVTLSAPSPRTPPEASPEGAIAAIKTAFAAAVEAGEVPPAPATGDEAAQVRHERSLKKWVAAANRTFKQTVEWPVLVEDSTILSATAGRLRLRTWDPVENETVGDPFQISVPRRLVDRVNRPRALEPGMPPVFRLQGVFVPRIRVNASRTEIGTFDKPRFISPMIEMDWNVDVRSVAPWSPPEATAVAEDAD